MKTITVTEFGSGVKKCLIASNIKFFEVLKYNTGETITLITFINDTNIHAIETYREIDLLINNC